MAALTDAYRDLRKRLDGHDANVQQQFSRRVIMTLAMSLYDDREDRVAANQMASELVAAGLRAGGSGLTSQAPSSAHLRSAYPAAGVRTAHDIAMCFREASSKSS